MTNDVTTVSQLEKLRMAIEGYDDPRRASGEWKQVYKLLTKTELASDRVTHIVGMREVAQLAELIDELRNPITESPPQGELPSRETCRRALRAFRKRLALTRLDEESRIGGHSALTSGADPRMSAIVPPTEWPDCVWQELVRQGKLRYVGHGFYQQMNQ